MDPDLSAEKAASLYQSGWCRFEYDPRLAAWVRVTGQHAARIENDSSSLQALRCGGTWFPGVSVLENDGNGALSGGAPIAGDAVDFVTGTLGLPQNGWDRAQVSVIYPGYPRPSDGESEAAFQFRVRRDAAHVDGLIPRGEGKARYLCEHHRFILGIPLGPATAKTSPFVVWEGSHHIMRESFAAALEGHRASAWEQVDLTQVYQCARRRIFDSCRRVALWGQPGEAYLVHRLALHGVAPWREHSVDDATGRSVCYFRPPFDDVASWLNAP